MNVRKARTGVQLAQVRALDRLCFPWDDPYQTRGAEWWLAYDDEGHVIGYAGIKWTAHAQCWFLCRVGVLPSARGMGAARRLTAARLRYARLRRPGSVVVTYCTADNHASANNLINHGFKLYAPEEPWGTLDSLYWRLEL